jgi:ribosome biogenesis GTPase
MTADGVIECAITNKLRKKLVYPLYPDRKALKGVVEVTDIKVVDPVAVGDEVRLIRSGDATGVIVEVQPRRNALTRKAAGDKPIRQIIATNVDQMVVVVSAAKPRISWELVDRYLVVAAAAEVSAMIVVTKIDLVAEESLSSELGVYRGLGYVCLPVSAPQRRGVDQVAEQMKGKLSVLAGKSGVGKTTLLNRLESGLGLRVNEVSQSMNKGKHTTTHVEMFPLTIGGAIIDTPGMRELGIYDASTPRQRAEHEDFDIASLMPDLAPHLGQCRFGLSCTHTHEPQCSIKEAVHDESISSRRYESYLRMVNDRK